MSVCLSVVRLCVRACVQAGVEVVGWWTELVMALTSTLTSTQCSSRGSCPNLTSSTHHYSLTPTFRYRAVTWVFGSLLAFTYTHTHPFNGPLCGTTQVSRYQKGKTNLDFTKARDSEWQWHQLGHIQVCTSLQTDNHASTPPVIFLQDGCPFAAQPTASKHWRHIPLNQFIHLQKFIFIC